MDESFNRQLHDLITEIGSLPKSEQGKCEKLVKETNAATQESIDFLRLSIKYVLFDLEATRRENEYLRRLLDESRD